MTNEEDKGQSPPDREDRGQALPLVDWRRTIRLTGPFTSIMATLVLVGVLGEESAVGTAAMIAWSAGLLAGIPGIAFWLGLKSRASTVLGPTLFGVTTIAASALVGFVSAAISNPDFHLTDAVWVMSVLALFGVFIATGAGFVGFRRTHKRMPSHRGMACPQCDSGLGDVSLLIAPLVKWRRCGACGTRLVGSRFVQALAIAESIAAGAALLAVIYALSIGWILSGQDLERFVVKFLGPLLASIMTVGFAFVLLFSAVIFVAVRVARDPSQRYRVSSSGEATPVVLRRYLVGVGILSALALAFLVLYAGFSTGGETVLVASAFVPFLLLYPFYDRELNDRLRTSASTILLVWSGGVIAAVAILAFFAVANFPKEQPFQEDYALEPRRVSEYDAWDEMIRLTKDENTDNETILAFLSENIASVPDDDYKIALSFDADFPRVVQLPVVFEEELGSINSLFERDDVAEANARHLRLWKAARNMASGNGTLIQALIAMGLTASLVEFYFDTNAEALKPSLAEVAKIAADLSADINDSLRRAFILEYLGASNFVVNIGENVCFLLAIEEPTGRCNWTINWPFYDHQEHLRRTHDYYGSFFDRSFPRSFEVDAFVSQSFLSRLLDPIGSAVDAALIPAMGKFSDRGEVQAASLAAFGFVLRAKRSGDLDDVPIDPRTGQPFRVMRDGDTVTISSIGSESVRYEFNLPRLSDK